MNLAHTTLKLMVRVIASLFGRSLPGNPLGPRQAEVRKFSTRVLGQRLVRAVDHLRDFGGEPATAALLLPWGIAYHPKASIFLPFAGLSGARSAGLEPATF